MRALALRLGLRLPANARRLLNLARGIDTPALVERPPGRRVAVLAPHPDDELIGCGGTLRKHVLAGDDVTVVFVTSGERTAGLASLPAAERAPRREDEARAAAAVLGLAPASLRFLRLPDGAVPTDSDLGLSAVGPDLVYAPFPVDAHRDHVACVGALAAALPGLPTIARVALYEVWTPLYPNCVVDVTEEIDMKVDALRRYESALVSVDYPHTVRGLAAYRSAQCLHGRGYAEAFLVVDPGRLMELLGEA